MNTLVLSALLVTFVAVFQTTDAAINCYECTGCNDPFDRSQASVTQCPTSCSKSKGGVLGQNYVSRGCGSSTSTGKCQDVSGVGTYCECDTDKCNSATTSGPVGAVVFGITAMATIAVIKRLL